MPTARAFTVSVLTLGLLAAACGKKDPPVELAPAASVALAAPEPASAKSVTLAIDTPTSSVKFLMDSPLEKIDGDAPGSASGELAIDLEDLSKSNGLVKVDLDKLTLYQQKRADEGAAYGERVSSAKQNEHARDWFQITPREGEVTPEQAQANRMVEFRIEKVDAPVKNVLALTGPERKVTATISGTLRLHGRQAPKSTKAELTFRFQGDKLESVTAKTLEPVVVELEKFEIHPRDGAGKLTKAITEAVATTLKGKVSNEAPVMMEFSAKPK